MSDIGNDTASSTMGMAAKGMDLILKLIQYLMNSEERKLNRLKAQELQVGLLEKKASRKLDHSSGYVNAKKLVKSGERLENLGMSVTQKEFERFSALARREGLVFSGIEYKDDAGTVNYSLTIRAKDTSHAKNIFDRLAEEQLNDEINDLEIQEKNGTLAGQAKSVLVSLRIKREGYMHTMREKFNESNASIIFAKIRDQLKDDSLSFDRAVNRFTDRGYVPPVPMCIVERTNPDNFIVLNASNATYKGKTYIKTDYTVYKDGKEVGTYNDARFDGRPANFWANLKNEMKSAGNFSDDVVVLGSKADLDIYRQKYGEWQKEDDALTNAKGNHQEAVTLLETQLKKNQTLLESGEIETNDILVAENTIIERQIKNYGELAVCLEQIKSERDRLDGLGDISDDAHYHELKATKGDLENKASALLHERNQLTGISAARSTEIERSENEKAAVNEVAANKAAPPVIVTEKTAESSEQLSSNQPLTLKMADYKAEIAKRMAKNKANKEVAAKTKETPKAKMPTIKEER